MYWDYLVHEVVQIPNSPKGTATKSPLPHSPFNIFHIDKGLNTNCSLENRKLPRKNATTSADSSSYMSFTFLFHLDV